MSADALELIASSARMVARSDDLDTVLDRLLRSVASHLGAPVGGVFLLDQDEPRMELAASVGTGELDEAALAGTLEDADDPVAIAARERRTVLVDAPDGSKGRFMERCAEGDAAFVPLVVGRGGIDVAVGVLGLCWAGERPPEGRLAVLSIVADLAAAAVDRTRVLSLGVERSEWFERLAHTDALTGLANRRMLDRVLELELARAGRQESELTVACFDVDGFGEAVEAGGNATGDLLLRAVAVVLAESVRLVDTVARSGPHEFVLVAPGSAGTVVAERVLQGVARLEPVAGRQVSISAGVARFPIDGTTASELLAAAGAALATARAGGGGRVASGSAR